jgi:hypothetical protein
VKNINKLDLELGIAMVYAIAVGIFVLVALTSCATVSTDVIAVDGTICKAQASSLFLGVSNVKMKGCGAAVSAEKTEVDSDTLGAILKAIGSTLSKSKEE